MPFCQFLDSPGILVVPNYYYSYCLDFDVVGFCEFVITSELISWFKKILTLSAKHSITSSQLLHYLQHLF